MSSVLEWARFHMEAGYSPIPIIRGSKNPLIEWKPFQTQRPTDDLLQEWFPAGADRNLALVTGSFHRLVVIDADDEEAVRFARLQFAPTPYRVRTRRGLHFYYRHPGGGIHIVTKARVIPGHNLDAKADGGICTGLGSVHASGHVYHLDEGAEMVSVHDLPVFDPSWLPKAAPLLPPLVDRTLDGVQRAERYLDRCEGAGAGGRNANTFRVAASVVRDFGLTMEQGWALLSAWNAQRNDPPLSEDELRVIVQSCLRSGRRAYGERLREPMGSIR